MDFHTLFQQLFVDNDSDKLQDLIQNTYLQQTFLRFNVWRALLGIYEFDDDIQTKFSKISNARTRYQQLQAKYICSDTSSQQVQRNPLGGIVQSPIENAELKMDIKKDVERTFQEKELFQKPQIKQLLTNNLFIWSKLNSEISYKQGINEIVGTIILVYFDEIQTNQTHEMGAQFMNPDYAEADIYAVFELCMNKTEHMEMFRSNYTEKQKAQLKSKKPSAILTRCSKIQDIHLKKVDLELFRHLKLMNMAEMYINKRIQYRLVIIILGCYSFRISLEQQGGQSFPIRLGIKFLIVLTKEDSSQCLQVYLKYPKIPATKPIIDQAFHFKEILLQKEDAIQSKSPEKKKDHVPLLFKPDDFKGNEKQERQLQQKFQNASLTKPVFLSKQEQQPIESAYEQKQEQILEQPQKTQNSIEDSQPIFLWKEDQKQCQQQVKQIRQSNQDTKDQDNNIFQQNSKQQQQFLNFRSAASYEQSVKVPIDQAEQMLEILQKSLMHLKQINDNSESYQETLRGLQTMKNFFQTDINAQQVDQLEKECKQGRQSGVQTSTSNTGFVIKKSVDTGLQKMGQFFKKKW